MFYIKYGYNGYILNKLLNWLRFLCNYFCNFGVTEGVTDKKIAKNEIHTFFTFWDWLTKCCTENGYNGYKLQIDWCNQKCNRDVTDKVTLIGYLNLCEIPVKHRRVFQDFYMPGCWPHTPRF